MKSLKYLLLPVVLLLFFAISSCTDTFDEIKKYTEGGETIYTNKVDSLVTFPGNKRVKISGYISNAYTVKEVVVAWNKGKNSQTFPYTKSSKATDKVDLIVTGLEEKFTEFEVYTKDASGNTSLKIKTSSQVYGDSYKSNLEPRVISKVLLNSGTKIISMVFKASEEFARNTEIKYTNLTGNEVVKILDKSSTSVDLDQINSSLPILYRTFYVPTLPDAKNNETSLDLFDSKWVEFKFSNIKSISESITVSPIALGGGINVTWNNPTNLPVKFYVDYNINGSPNSSPLISSNLTTENKDVIGLSSGNQTITVYLSDNYGGTVKKNYSVNVVTSPYEGTYAESGTLVRGTNPTDILSGDVFLSTINVNTLRAQAGTSVFNNPAILYQIRVNSDNSVTIISEPTASVVITPQAGVPSSYNPTTKIFDLHYEYTTSALRKFDTQLKLK